MRNYPCLDPCVGGTFSFGGGERRKEGEREREREKQRERKRETVREKERERDTCSSGGGDGGGCQLAPGFIIFSRGTPAEDNTSAVVERSNGSNSTPPSGLSGCSSEFMARSRSNSAHTTEGPSWGHSKVVLGAIRSFLESFCGHLSPKIDKVSEELTLRSHEEPCVVRQSRLVSSLGLQVKIRKIFSAVPAWLGIRGGIKGGAIPFPMRRAPHSEPLYLNLNRKPQNQDLIPYTVTCVARFRKKFPPD